MAAVGLVSKDVISKGRIMEELKLKGHDCTNINNNVFDASAFDLIVVDLDDPIALLVLKNVGYKCIAFGAANDEQKLVSAKLAGCDRVYKHGEFFKKILPNLKI